MIILLSPCQHLWFLTAGENKRVLLWASRLNVKKKKKLEKVLVTFIALKITL